MKPSAEALWLGVFAGAGALGAGWLAAGLPLPACPFHAITGVPCPGCGSTRAFRSLLALDVPGAFRAQPLAAAVMAAVAVYCAYAAGAVAGVWGRWRPPPPLPAQWARWRVVALVALVANWAYLVWRELG